MNKRASSQLFPIFLTLIIFFILVSILWLTITILNTITEYDISLHIRFADIFIGLTIYLKTSIDFAIYIGRLMDKNPGIRSRIAIEIGTALGNAAGTIVILIIWTFFKEVDWLLALMILIASLVLFRLAEDGLEHIDTSNKKYPNWFISFILLFDKVLHKLNGKIEPILGKVIPSTKMNVKKGLAFWALFSLAFSVPFILGLDDFAGYVPLFNVINVFGFAIGVFLGHMVLNMLLYISPSHTTKAVKNPVISFAGSLAFVGLGVWGLIEVVKLVAHFH